MTYLLDALPNYKMHINSVKISLGGDVKLGMPPNHHASSADLLDPDHQYQDPRDEIYDTGYQYNSALVSTILEILMAPGTPRDKPWSEQALEFAAIPPSDSLATLMSVSL
jgi:hypothetical protein